MKAILHIIKSKQHITFTWSEAKLTNTAIMSLLKKELRLCVLLLCISYSLLIFLYELSSIEEILCRVSLIMFRSVSQSLNEVLCKEVTAFLYNMLIQQVFNFSLRLTVHLYWFRVIRLQSIKRIWIWQRHRLKYDNSEDRINASCRRYIKLIDKTADAL